LVEYLVYLGLISVTFVSQQLFQSTPFNKIFGIAIRLRAGQSGIRIPAATRDFFFLSPKPSGPVLGPNQPLFNGYGFSFLGWNCRCVELTTNLYLLPRLRMCGAVPLLPLFAFVSWTGTYLVRCRDYKVPR